MDSFPDYYSENQYIFNQHRRVSQLDSINYIESNIFIEKESFRKKWVSKLVDSLVFAFLDKEHRFIQSFGAYLKDLEDEDIAEMRTSAMDRLENGLPLTFGKKKESHKKKTKTKTKVTKSKKKEQKAEEISTIPVDDLYNCICEGLYETEEDSCYLPIYIHDLYDEHRYVAEFIGIPGLILLEKEKVRPVADPSSLYPLFFKNDFEGHYHDPPEEKSEQESQTSEKPSIPPSLQKYWKHRHQLFRLFDQGIQYDEEGLYSITPEPIAIYLAHRLRCSLLYDAFSGVGGNSIHFAKTCDRVISSDIDRAKLQYLRHNAALYHVQDKIECLHGDCQQFISMIKADIVFLAPPWGGPEYIKKEVFLMTDFPQSIDMRTLFKKARKITRNVVLLLPRNINKKEWIQLADKNEVVEFQDCIIDNITKMVAVYYGDLPNTKEMKNAKLCF